MQDTRHTSLEPSTPNTGNYCQSDALLFTWQLFIDSDISLISAIVSVAPRIDGTRFYLVIFAPIIQMVPTSPSRSRGSRPSASRAAGFMVLLFVLHPTIRHGLLINSPIAPTVEPLLIYSTITGFSFNVDSPS